MRKSVKFTLLSVTLILLVSLAVKGYVLQVASGTWAVQPDLGAARSGASAILLKDGRVLVTGGDSTGGTLASAEFIGLDGTSSTAAPMNVARNRHVSALLPSGNVLVAGGTTTGGGATNASEIYDPTTDSWTTVSGGMSEARANATAVVLQDGRVLIAGGDKSGVASTTLEIFDPISTSFSSAGALSSPRTEHATALLPDGRVLIAGGSNGSTSLNSTDIYDPTAATITLGPAMSTSRSGLSATAMLDGRILLAGGSNGSSDLATAEIFDPVMLTVAPATSSLTTARQGHQAFLLPNNNNVLIVGGTSASAPLASAELYTPWLATFAPTGSLSSARTLSAASRMKQDGLLVVAGGQDATGVAVATKDVYGFATVKTDASDYPPGTTVNIIGSGWQPGESVTLTLIESPNLDTHGPYTVVADGNGSISDSSFTTDLHDAGIRFYLTAVGTQSQAQNTFTDNKTVSIAFTGTGSGTVTSTGGSGSLNCMSTGGSSAGACSNGSFGNNDTVTLTAAPLTPSTVGAWTVPSYTILAGCSAGSLTCKFTMDNSSETITVGFNPGPANKLVFGQQPTTAQAGASITPTISVKVVDTGGNIVNSSAAITMAIGTNPGGGTLSGTTTVNAVNGVATFAGLSINKTGTGYTLAASSGVLTGATSNAFNITAGTASKLVFTAQPNNSTAGSAFSTQPQVTIQDANGNTVNSTASVTLAITSGTGTPGAALTCTANPLAATAGVATFAGCKIDKAGTGYTLTATTAGLTSAISNSFDISAGLAAKVVFTTQPSISASSGTAFAQQPVVTVQDAVGNAITGSTASINLTITSGTGTAGAALTCTTNPLAAAAGVATFAGCKIDKSGTGYTLTAASSGLTSAVSTAITVSAGTASQLVFTTSPSNSTGGTAFATQPIVTLEDSQGNPVTGTAQTVTLAIQDNAGPAGVLNGTKTVAVNTATGQATFVGLSINKIGTAYTLTATGNTINTTPGVVVSSAFNITAGPATQLVFSSSPSNSTAGVAFGTQPVVTAQDAGGNTATGSSAPISLTITAGTGTAGAALSCTTNPLNAAAGVATFAGCKIDKTGTNYTLTASGAGLTSATSTAFNIAAGVASKLVFTQQPTSTNAGQAITPAVVAQVQDAVGNVVTGDNSSVTIAISTGGVLSGSSTTTVVASSGVATFANLVPTVTGSFTLTASDGALASATSTNFTVNAGALDHFTFSTIASPQTAGTAFGITVTAKDAANNTVTSFDANGNKVMLTSTGALVGAPITSPSFTNGVLITSVTINNTGNFTIAATGIGGNNVITGTSNSFTVNPGAATKLAFGQQPSNATAGAAITPAVTVLVEDSLNNLVTSSTAAIGVAIGTNPGAATLSGVTSANAVNGVATFSNLSISKGGVGYTLTATSTSLAAATSALFTISNPTPTLTSITPASGNLSQTLDVVFTGSNFISGVSSVSFGADVTVNTVTINSATQITANVTINSTATPGTRSVSVTNSAPGGTATLVNAFTINNPATTTVVTASPNPSTFGGSVTFTATVFAGSGIPTGSVAFYDGGTCVTTGTLLAGPTTLDGTGKAGFSTATFSAGSHAIVACYTPTGIYLASGSSLTQVVNQAQATLAFDNLTFTYDGAPKSVTVTTTPSGLAGVTISYSGGATPPTNAGTTPVSATLTNPNYTATPLSGTETIQAAPVVITIIDPMPTYDGNPHSANISIVPLVGVTITYNGSTTPPTAAGVYAVSVVTTDANYAGMANGTLTILQAQPVVTWSNPADISFGTPLSATQLNATATVPGTFTYTPASGTFLNAGDGQTLTVDFAPTDSTNYSPVLGTHVLINVKAAPLYVISNDGTRAFGQSNPSFTPTFIGLQDGDTPGSFNSVTCLSAAGATSAPGTYAANCSGVNSSNYTVKYIAGTLSVTNPLSAITEIKGASSHSETLTIGQTDTLTATGKFADASSRSLSVAGGSSFARSPLSTPVSGAAMAEAGGVLYAIGGFDGATILKTIQAYDPENDSWSISSAALSTPRRDAAVASVAGKIYVIGGKDAGGNALSSIEVIDTTVATPAVSAYSASLSTARSLSGAAAFNNKIYVVAGSDSSSNPLSTVETFDLITGATSTSDPGNAFSQASAAVFTKNNSAQLYVAGVSGSSVKLVTFDGTTWSSPVSTSLDGTQTVGVAAFVDSLYLVNGSNVWSYDGANFTQKNSLGNPHNGAQPVAIGALIYVASANSASPSSTLDALAPDELKWTSADSAKATVDQSGKIAALAITDPGTVAITAASLSNPAITADFTLTIVKKMQTIQFNILGAKAYGDADFQITATSFDSTSQPTGLFISFTAGSGDACTVGASTLNSGASNAMVHITGAGSCTITAAQPGDDTTWQAATSVPQSFTIAKATPTVVVTPYNLTYDGNPHSATGTVTGVKSETLAGLDLTATTHTAAGDYPSDAWTFTDTTGNYNNASGVTHDVIIKADPVLTAIGGTFTYNGNPHAGSATVIGVQNESLTPVNIAYKDSSNNLLTTPPVNAGTYSVAARFAGNANYNQKQSASVPLIIKQASALISVTQYTVTYDGNPHTATGSAHGVESSSPVDLIALLHLVGTTHTDAGTYASDPWTFDGNINYLAANGTVSDTIIKADSTTTVTCPAIVTFDGNPQTPCTAIATGAGGLSVPVTVTYSANTYAGAATATANYLGDTNHNPSNDSKTFVINKAPSSTVITCPASVTYDGTAQMPCSAVATGVAGLNASVSVTYANNTNAGTATANATYPGDANHLTSSDSKTFVINQAVSSTLITCPVSVTYDGNPQTPCTAIATGVGGLSASVPVTHSANIAAGTATANATFTGDNNHIGSSDIKTFTIAKAVSLTVVTCPAMVTYNGLPQTPCTVAVTGAGGLSLTPTATYISNLNAGTAIASYSYPGDENHFASADTKTFTISQAPSSTVVTCASPVIYNGSLQMPCSVAITGVGGLNLAAAPSYNNNLNAGTGLASYSYPGDPNHLPSNGSGMFTISPATTTTTVTSSTNPSNWGQVAIFTATVMPQIGGMPTGSVAFYNALSGATCASLAAANTSPLDTVQLTTVGAGQQATYGNAWLPVGSDTILACYTGDLNFIGGSSSISQTVIAAPIAVLAPATLSFGNQQGGTVSGPQTLAISNPNGTAPLLISSIKLAGTNPTYFTESDSCSSVSVGASCTITVKFAPPVNATGVATATLVVTDNDENATGSTQSSQLTGAGVSSINSVGSLSTFGLFATTNGCSSINMSGNAIVDSFNSGGANTSGNVGTNGNANLSGNPVINGAVYSPAAGTGSCSTKSVTGLSTSGKAQATGGLKLLAAPLTYPAPPAPIPAPPTNTQNISGSCGTVAGCTSGGSKIVNLAPGQYGNLSITGGTTAHFTPGTYNFNSLTLSGNSILAVDASTGPIVVNLAGAGFNGGNAVLDLTGGVMSNSSGEARKLQFYYAGTQPVKLTGNTASYAAVYAPNAPINLSGGSHFYGAITGSTINNSGGTAIHYDASLPNIPAGDYLWFSSAALNVKGLPTSGSVKIYVTNASISFPSTAAQCTGSFNATINQCTLPVPNAVVTFSPTATAASTTWDATNNRWSTLVPTNGLTTMQTHAFLDGLVYQVPAAFPNGLQNVTWSAAFSTSTTGVSFSWQWGAAVYSSFNTSYPTLSINPLDNADPAGTPEAYKSSLVLGASGPDYIGLYTGAAGVVPTIAEASVAPSSLDFTNGGTATQTVGSPSTPMTAVLTNNMSGVLAISGVQLTGTNAADFTQTNNCPITPNTLASGGTCTITVTLSPASTGKKTAKIVVNDSANNTPQTVFLKGSAQ